MTANESDDWLLARVENLEVLHHHVFDSHASSIFPILWRYLLVGGQGRQVVARTVKKSSVDEDYFDALVFLCGSNDFADLLLANPSDRIFLSQVPEGNLKESLDSGAPCNPILSLVAFRKRW